MATNGDEEPTTVEEKMDVQEQGGENIVEIASSAPTDQPMTVIELGGQTDSLQDVGSSTSGATATPVNEPVVAVSESDATEPADTVATVVASQGPEATVTVTAWSADTPAAEISSANEASVTAAVITLPTEAVTNPTVPTSLPLTTVTVSSTNRRPSASSPGKPSFRQWTFEEQFKQLYELSADKDRREFLDSLFDFMQRRGTPVNRIPIMAKTTLDLYKLFCEVVARGGLVEVINKKLWREVANSLNVPSSITSAAFTLRTQYIKYLYPYECETKHLSSPEELHMAVDVNRRDARTPVAGTPQTPGTPHTPVRLLMDPNQASPLSIQTQPGVSTPSTAVSVGASTPASGEPAAKKPRLNIATATPVAQAISAGSIPTATLAALPTTPYCNIRISHAAADASGNVQELPPAEASASDGSTIFVSMEINGLLYQGFLYVRQPLITVQPTAAAVSAAAAALATTPHTSS